jgi:hypothetical protein
VHGGRGEGEGERKRVSWKCSCLGGCAQINFSSGANGAVRIVMDQLPLLEASRPKMGTTGGSVGAGIISPNQHAGHGYDLVFRSPPEGPRRAKGRRRAPKPASRGTGLRAPPGTFLID